MLKNQLTAMYKEILELVPIKMHFKSFKENSFHAAVLGQKKGAAQYLVKNFSYLIPGPTMPIIPSTPVLPAWTGNTSSGFLAGFHHHPATSIQELVVTEPETF